jgi:hypothetical protein
MMPAGTALDDHEIARPESAETRRIEGHHRGAARWFVLRERRSEVIIKDVL